MVGIFYPGDTVKPTDHLGEHFWFHCNIRYIVKEKFHDTKRFSIEENDEIYRIEDWDLFKMKESK